MTGERSHMAILRELLDSQLLGVLGTQHEGEPYTSLVGFATTSDLKEILFTTGRSTRKLQNLAGDARASMLIDNRRNRVADFTEASAATAVGVVEEIAEEDRAEFERLYLAKHPQLEAFVRSPSCIQLRLKVSVYMVVAQFQHVLELHIDP